jgi:hypothetical protein
MGKERWYEDIPLSEYGEQFKEIAEIVGKDKAIELYDKFNKTSVLFSNAPFYRAKKYYIRANRHQYSPTYMARVLGVSIRFVYSALEEKEPNLFE